MKRAARRKPVKRRSENAGVRFIAHKLVEDDCCLICGASDSKRRYVGASTPHSDHLGTLVYCVPCVRGLARAAELI